jgi:ribosomal protein S18 acetylase RimI-like enzyme
MHPLDNVIWKALTTRQAQFAERHGQACRFIPEVAPLAAFLEPTARAYESLAGLVETGKTVALSLDEPYEPRQGWKLVAAALMPQMVHDGGGPPDVSSDTDDEIVHHEIVELGATDTSEMMALTALTKPGPFNKRTYELGTYLGIRCEKKLIAMAGERLKVPGYTEVSAVCTHPDHVGHGYAGLLMSKVMAGIYRRGEIPFLHVRGDNVRAIELYRRLGFERRIVSHLAILRKVES